MTTRRVVIDRQVPTPVICPACGVALDVRREDLRLVDFGWRCGPGRHPKTFELRCAKCSRLAIVYELDGIFALVPDQSSALAEVRARARDAAGFGERSDGRDRNR